MKNFIVYSGEHKLSYAEYGDPKGYPVLIQHGMIASIDDASLFDGLIQLGLRLICVARPGYGQSSPYVMRNLAEWGDIVSQLVENLGLPQFDLFGISSGASYCYSIGRKFPDRTRNIYILSGTPAFYDPGILEHWPFEVKKDASISDMEKVAKEVFFSNVSEDDEKKNDIRDSMMNNCFGLAQDLKLRGADWGFSLSELFSRVYMRHSVTDPAVPFITAELTSRLLPNCVFDVKEKDPHFSQEVLEAFISEVIAKHLGTML